MLRFPADNLRSGLDRSVEQLGTRREETLHQRGESDVALTYLSNLVRESAKQRTMVDDIDLDSPPPWLKKLDASLPAKPLRATTFSTHSRRPMVRPRMWLAVTLSAGTQQLLLRADSTWRR